MYQIAVFDEGDAVLDVVTVERGEDIAAALDYILEANSERGRLEVGYGGRLLYVVDRRGKFFPANQYRSARD